jgi:type VI secretion system protein ImpH
MGAAVGREADTLAFLARLADAPYDYDFYQTLRRISVSIPAARAGEAQRPLDEPIRLGQDPDLTFAPAPLARFGSEPGGAKPRLQVRLFGLFGPNGPLPTHLTEYAGSAAQCRRPDVQPLPGRVPSPVRGAVLRAWAQAQPHVNRESPEADRFGGYLGALVGVRPSAARNRDTVPDVAKLFHVGVLIRHVRNAEGLQSILRHFFKVPIRIEQFVLHWMALGADERTRLGRPGAILGHSALAGGRVWDAQHKFRVVIGALTLQEYESFLPGGARLRKLIDWIAFYLSHELDWDLRLILKRPGTTLDG